MAFDHTNQEDQKDALNHAKEIVDDYYNSSMYSGAWDRFERRRDAYYQRTRSDEPAWRSKLHLASFWLSCKALHAMFSKAHRNAPFVYVDAQDNSLVDPGAKEKAQLAHSDLNYDLHLGRFHPKLMDMYWYVEMFGTAVGREYIRSESKVEKARTPNPNGFGSIMIENRKRLEYTQTDIIHPLNFAHDRTRRDFFDSPWGSVRFELPVSEVYRMKGDPKYNQRGVNALIEKIEDGQGGQFTTGRNTFYSERGNDGRTRRHWVIVNEWDGPLQIKGNMNNQGRYYGLYSKDINDWLILIPSPFKMKPYWKMQGWPDPDGPYGVGPNDMILPLNYWENSTVNQYQDYMNSILKFMYEVQPDSIIGGMDMLINGLPYGILPLEEDLTPGNASIAAVEKSRGTLPPLESMLNLIENYKQDQGMSSNLRGKSSDQLADTATGITLQQNREDDFVAAIQESCDQGLKDAMHIKMQNRTDFFDEDVFANIEGSSEIVQHKPYELSNVDWSFRVNRSQPDIEAGKAINFLKLLGGLDNIMSAKGQPLPPQMLIDANKEVGKMLGIDGVDEIFNQLESLPPQVQTQAGVAPGGQTPVAPIGGASENAIALT